MALRVYLTIRCQSGMATILGHGPWCQSSSAARWGWVHVLPCVAGDLSSLCLTNHMAAAILSTLPLLPVLLPKG